MQPIRALHMILMPRREPRIFTQSLWRARSFRLDSLDRRHLLSSVMKDLVSRFDAAWEPSVASLAGKVMLLAALAGALALGHRHPLAVWWVLLEGFYCAAAALDFAIALVCREKLLAAYNHWHEAALLAGMAFLSRMATIAG
jgi:hypothetical protein